jgi:uncharacterized protein
MQLNEIQFSDATPIDGYGPGFFRVGGQPIMGHALCTRAVAKTWGGYDDVQPLLDLAQQVDVLFIGTGDEISHIPTDLRNTLEQTGLGVEVMNSPAACRTYNILLSEGRRVAAALITTS